MNEIAKADPAAQRRMGVLVAVVGLAGGVLIFSIQRWLPDLLRWAVGGPGRIWWVAAGLVLVVCGPLLILALYFLRMASRIARAGRFPPPGVKVIRDTPVLEGPAVGRRVLLLRGMAVAVGALGLIMAALLGRLFLLFSAGL